jgi:RimJ/RimL family protein N-acetyltransferase
MDRLPDSIGGREIRLRRAKPADAVVLYALFNNWNVVRWLARPQWPVPFAKVEAYLDAVNRDASGEHYWAIERDGVVLGAISAGMAPASEHQSGEGPHVGYWLGEPYWGQGVMSEAARLLVYSILNAMPVPAIYSGLFQGNHGSWRIQEKLGFSIEGRNTLFCGPQGLELPHVSTVLSRASFDALRHEGHLPRCSLRMEQ